MVKVILKQKKSEGIHEEFDIKNPSELKEKIDAFCRKCDASDDIECTVGDKILLVRHSRYDERKINFGGNTTYGQNREELEQLVKILLLEKQLRKKSLQSFPLLPDSEGCCTIL